MQKSFFLSLFILIFLASATPAFAAKSSGTTEGGCKINYLSQVHGYTPNTNYEYYGQALRWDIDSKCSYATMSVPSGNTPISPNVGRGSFLFSANYGAPNYPMYSGNYILTAYDSGGESVSVSTYLEGGVLILPNYISAFSYNSGNNTANWTIQNNTNWTFRILLNGSIVGMGNANGQTSGSGSTRAGINTLRIELLDYGGGGATPFTVDELQFNFPAATGGGGGGGTTAQIDVVVTGDKPNAAWEIEPGPFNETGNKTITVTPPPGGTNYGIMQWPEESGCATTITNSDGPGSSMHVSPNQNKQFTLNVDCLPPPGSAPTVDIKANNDDGPINISSGSSATLTWNSQNATSCNGYGAWTGSQPISSAGVSTGPLYTNSTYTIRCFGSVSPPGSDAVIINVTETPPPAPSITATTSSSCQAIRVSWSGYDLSKATGFRIYRDGALVGTVGKVLFFEDSTPIANMTYTYRVKAYNGAGESGNSNQVFGVSSGTCNPVPSIDLTAVPGSLPSGGGSSTLTWTTAGNPTLCMASSNPSNTGWDGSRQVGGDSVTLPNITQTTTFRMDCSNANGSDFDEKTVSVAGAPPVVSFSANPTSVTSGSNTVLRWTVSNATSCTASATPSNAQWSGSKSFSVSQLDQTITNLTQNTTFRLSCTNTFGTTQRDASVSVGPLPLPTVSLNAIPTSLVGAGTTTLQWTVSNATSCSASASPANGSWTGTKTSTGGSQNVPLSQTTTFSLACGNTTGTSTANRQVTVSSANATINVTSNNSAASWTIDPGGIVGSGTSESHVVTPSGITPYTISVNTIPNHDFTVSATDGSGNTVSGTSVLAEAGDTVSFAITYTATGPAFDYSLSNGGNVSITKSSGPVSNSTTVTKTLVQGTSQPVTLLVSGIPGGSGISVAPPTHQSCTLTCVSTLIFTAQSSANPGTYPITVTGTSSGTPNKTTSFNLIISNPSGNLPTTVTPTPGSPANPNTPISWDANVPGATNCAFTWSGTEVPTSPAPTGDPYVITYPTSGVKDITADASCSEGTGSGDGSIIISPDIDIIEI